jgi:type III secretion protein C
MTMRTRFRPSSRCALACAALALLLACAAPAKAADLHWKGRPFQIVAADKPLPDFLRELAASQGTTAIVDAKVAGSISGRFNASPERILDNVCATNGLTWYYDGAFLYVEPASLARSEILSVSNATHVAETLKQLGIADSRYPVTLVDRDGQGSLHVAGPKHYVDMVRQTVHQIEGRDDADANAEIRVFPLKYAWAGDIRIRRGGHEQSIPGVANTLRDLFSRDGGAAGLRRNASAPFYTGATRELKLHSTGDSIEAPKVELPAAQMDGDLDLPGFMGGRSGRGGGLPQFQADTRMNAVIVRDLPEHMAQYAHLIQSMDVRPRLVEIDVTIMDISTDTLDSLGVDWRAHGAHADLQIGHGNQPGQSWGNGPADEASQNLALTPLGTMFSAAIGHDARNYLLARVSALAQTGNADLVARPKVLTLDNNEAVLENLQQFYVRVNGFQDAGLFTVTTGTAVRVTPLIVDSDPQRGVMMSIDIEDGALSADSVDQIPIVQRRTVNTQALVDEGQSLLIAGYTSEQKSLATSGVPVLKDVPLLGHLFRYDEKKRSHMERFYLLTPRLVSTGGTPASQLPPAAQGG